MPVRPSSLPAHHMRNNRPFCVRAKRHSCGIAKVKTRQAFYLGLGPDRIHVWPTTSGTVISATGTNGLLRYRVRHGEYG